MDLAGRGKPRRWDEAATAPFYVTDLNATLERVENMKIRRFKVCTSCRLGSDSRCVHSGWVVKR